MPDGWVYGSTLDKMYRLVWLVPEWRNVMTSDHDTLCLYEVGEVDTMDPEELGTRRLSLPERCRRLRGIGRDDEYCYP